MRNPVSPAAPADGGLPADRWARPPLDPLLRLDATELSALLRAREVGAVEVLDAVLRRADEIAPDVYPFAVRLDEMARRAAGEADRLLAAGEGGPLTGVPVSGKDSQWLAGVATSSGSLARTDFIPGATVGGLGRLVEAGAVLFAKTTTSEFCYFGISQSPSFGHTANPHDLGRTAGGSSGGAAAQVASWAGPLALGGDGGGSIRIPAAFCGVVGHKPTFGLVPHEPSAAGWKTLVAMGPMARSVRDCALVLDAIAGFDPSDRHSVGYARADHRGGPLRIAVSADLGFAAVDDSVRRAFADAVSALGDQNVELIEADPGLPSSVRTWALLATAEARWSEAAEYEGRFELLSPEVAEYLAFGETVSAADYVRAQFERERVHAAYAALFAATGADVLLTPTMGCAAFERARRFPEQIGGVAVEPTWLDWAPFLYDANLAGLPGCAVPIGADADGLPLSAQVLGPRLSDRRVLRAAAVLEAAVAGAIPGAPALDVSASDRDHAHMRGVSDAAPTGG